MPDAPDLRSRRRRGVFASLAFPAAGLVIPPPASSLGGSGGLGCHRVVPLIVRGFGLGGVIATFGLIVDIVGFLVLLTLVLASSVVLV